LEIGQLSINLHSKLELVGVIQMETLYIVELHHH